MSQGLSLGHVPFDRGWDFVFLKHKLGSARPAAPESARTSLVGGRERRGEALDRLFLVADPEDLERPEQVGVSAVEFAIEEFLIHLLPYLLAICATYGFVQRWYTHTSEQRVPWRSLVLERATFHVYLMGLVSGVLNRRVEYLPTPKGSDRGAMPRLVLPHLLIIALSVAAVLFALRQPPGCAVRELVVCPAEESSYP